MEWHYWLTIFLVCLGPGALGQCLYPPCPTGQDEVQQEAPPVAESNNCCAKKDEEMLSVQRNLSALWHTVTEFREVVARHLHHLHEHQVAMVGHQVKGTVPQMHSHGDSPRYDAAGEPLPPSRRAWRNKRPRRPLSSRHYHRHHHPQSPQDQGSDPFHGLDREPMPRAFAQPPTIRDTDDFHQAVCHMRPNSAVPDSHVHGTVLLYQKKTEGPTYVHLMLSGFKRSGPLLPVPSLDGDQKFFSLHGLHVHQEANFTNGCNFTGPHWNPLVQPHGGPNSPQRHIGDFGNVASDQDGSMNVLISIPSAQLSGEYAIYGRPLVIHELRDDLGSNPNDPGSVSTGNSGTRVACCLIERLDSQQQLQQPDEELQGQEEADNMAEDDNH